MMIKYSKFTSFLILATASFLGLNSIASENLSPTDTTRLLAEASMSEEHAVDAAEKAAERALEEAETALESSDAINTLDENAIMEKEKALLEAKSRIASKGKTSENKEPQQEEKISELAAQEQPQIQQEPTLVYSQSDFEEAPQKCTPTTENQSHIFNFCRGLGNLATCWLEVPRCIIMRNGQVPLWGIIGGAVEGTGLTGLRAIAGVMDIISLGWDQGALYEKQHNFVWQDNWQYRPGI